ncbi:HNH endonuclease [Litoreibacter roseus]|nr:HNH endonuclease signature motif containing protein [Litoreibacter roseus]
MTLLEIQVASAKALKLPESDRVVVPNGYSLPLQMSKVSDFERLRLAIGRKSAAFQNTSKSTGNNTKKMHLIVRSPSAAAMSQKALEELFTGRAELSNWTEQPTDDEEELRRRVLKARRLARMKRGSRSTTPDGQRNVKKISGASNRFVRDPNVIAWVLEEASGTCDACGQNAPFERDDGDPYLEVHHVRPLSEGGPDTIDNALACCPNCHRELHFGRQRHRFRLEVVHRINRLRDWPAR